MLFHPDIPSGANTKAKSPRKHADDRLRERQVRIRPLDSLPSLRGGIDVRWSDFRKRSSGRVGGYKFIIEIQTVSAGIPATGQGFAVGESGSSTERSGEAETQLAISKRRHGFERRQCD